MVTDQMPRTGDTTYDLISVIYHALQGAETYHTYVRDAETAGDGELAGFFREAQQEQQGMADRAKQLLGTRMSKGRSGS
jgi:rubrerythrin